MSVGPAEILVILILALVVFGPQRLPEVGRQVGSALRELRKMQDTVRGELDMVLHPEHGTRTSSASTVEPDDHSVVDPAAVDGANSGPEPAEAGPAAGAGNDEPGFSGPSDSFI